MTKIPPSLLSPTRLPLHHFRLFLFLLHRGRGRLAVAVIPSILFPFSLHLVRPLWAEFDNAQKAIHFPLGGANQPHRCRTRETKPTEERPRSEAEKEGPSWLK